ncbi:type 4 fimbriae expression regulatory protein [Collimonas fungivorans Ter331]|uniref:Type 4 fimbriae expression regulatory protein n=1 Tax=Collimonas fungivorans (strain Ter331) TaxID=1005048 RepID=G0ADT2_COLFT|nr:type 4 fimbriae expression regulatory protein [Collimonas fungivorans Ter331]
MSSPRILVVDDEAHLRELLEIALVKMGLDVDSADSLAAARSHLAQNDYALVLTDMRLPDGLGIELVREVSAGEKVIPIAVITAYGSADNAVMALKAGAFDYLSKPVALDQLRLMVQSALRVGKPVENQRPAADSKLRAGSGSALRLIGQSAAMQELRTQIVRLARSMGAGGDHRRVRQRQGAGGARYPCAQSARRQAVCRRQLRRHPGSLDGSGVLRLPQRRVYRRRRRPRRFFPGCQRRHLAAG